MIPHKIQWLKITWIVLLQKHRWIFVHNGLSVPLIHCDTNDVGSLIVIEIFPKEIIPSCADTLDLSMNKWWILLSVGMSRLLDIKAILLYSPKSHWVSDKRIWRIKMAPDIRNGYWGLTSQFALQINLCCNLNNLSVVPRPRLVSIDAPLLELGT